MFERILRPSSLVGIDVGSQAIKVIAVTTTTQGEYKATGMGIAPTPADAYARGQVQDVKALGLAIREALQTAKIKQRRAVLAVPAQAGFVRPITFPRMPLKEVRAAIALQPDRFIPFARDGAVYDIYPLAADPGSQEIPVLVAAAPRNVVEGLTAAAKVAGVKLARIDLEPLTLIRAAVATGQASLGSSTGIVDLGRSMAKISLFQGDVPVISRVVDVPHGGQKDQFDHMDDLFWDIRRSLEFALTQLRLPLSRVLVTGGVGGDDYLALSLTAYLRAFLANRLPGDFRAEAMHDPTGQIPTDHMLAFGLSLPPELLT